MFLDFSHIFSTTDLPGKFGVGMANPDSHILEVLILRCLSEFMPVVMRKEKERMRKKEKVLMEKVPRLDFSLPQVSLIS